MHMQAKERSPGCGASRPDGSTSNRLGDCHGQSLLMWASSYGGFPKIGGTLLGFL